jgi:hypothetical protein
VHAVGFDQAVGRGVDFVDIGLDDGDGTGRLAVGECIDEDGGFVAILQGVGEVEAANAEIDDARFRGQVAGCKAAGDFDAESIVAEEDVADAGDEDGGLDGFGACACRDLRVLRERWPGWRIMPRSRPGSSSMTTQMCCAPS